MSSVRWLGKLVATATVVAACSSLQPAARSSSTASPAGNNAPVSGSCPATQQTQTTPSSNLEVIWLKGTFCFVVRDITDILRPSNVAASEKFVAPQFISASEMSFVDGGIVRMRIGGPRTLVTKDGGSVYGWSPDGTSVAYVMGTSGTGFSELHINSRGQDRIADSSVPALKGGVGCVARSCSDRWDFRLRYSPSGAYIALVSLPVGVVRIWSADGKLLKSIESTEVTMSAWSGDALYWRDEKGIQRWRNGEQSLVLPGVSWIRPRASPGGGQIVYETRDAGGGQAHVNLLDTATFKTRELKSSRSEPAFLNAHLIWYQEERPCVPADGSKCPIEATTVETGKTYIYDLDDNTETESIIARVLDVWPHPA
jgi:hypothetical protein